MNLQTLTPQIPFLLVILVAFVAYGIMVRRELLIGARIWQGGIVIGLIAVGVSALNERLNLKLQPGQPAALFYFNPAVMLVCSGYCTFLAYRMQRVSDLHVWTLGDTKIILRSCPASKLPDADALLLPTGTGMRMRSGVAALVRNAGGESIETEAVRQIGRGIGVGKVIRTGAGTLAVGRVYHAAVYDPGKPLKADVLKRYVAQACAVARREGAESLAVPLGEYQGLGVAPSTAAIGEAVLKSRKAFAEIVFAVLEGRDAREAGAVIARLVAAEGGAGAAVP